MSALSQLTNEYNDEAQSSSTSAAQMNYNNNSSSSSSFFSKLWNKLTFCFHLIYSSFGLYFLWIFIHYFSVQLYVYYCAQPTLYGFFIAPFLASALHCRALNWAIYNSAHIIDHMWILLGTWICSKIVIHITMR